MKFSKVKVADWPHFGENAAHTVKLYVVFVLCLLFVLCIFVILIVSHFGFEGGTLILIAPVPGHCLPFTTLEHYSCIRSVYFETIEI